MPVGSPISRASRSCARATWRSGGRRGRSNATSAAARKAIRIAELPPKPPPRGDSLASTASKGGRSNAAAATPSSAASGWRASSPVEPASTTLYPWRTRYPPGKGWSSTVTATSTATLTVRASGWKRPRGQMSRVPPARSTRHHAFTVTIGSSGSAGQRPLGPFSRSGPPVAGGDLRIETRHLHPARQDPGAQAGREVVPPGVEGRHPGGRDRLVADALERQRIDPGVAQLHPVVQVGAGGEARGAGVGDDVPLPHPRARTDAGGEAREVEVGGEVAAAVLHLHHVATPLVPAGGDHRAVGRHLHRRAHGGAVVDPVVRPVFVENGVEAVEVEGGGDAGVAQRRAEEHLPRRRAVAVEIDPGVAVAVGLVQPPVVVVDRRQDRPHVVGLAVEEDLLVEHLEAVPGLEILVEVEVPLEDVGQPVGQHGRAAGRADRLLHRPGEGPLEGADLDAAGERLPVALPLAAVADHLHPAAPLERHLEGGQAGVGVEEGRIAVAGLEAAGVDLAGQGVGGVAERGALEPELAEDVRDRLAPQQLRLDRDAGAADPGSGFVGERDAGAETGGRRQRVGGPVVGFEVARAQGYTGAEGDQPERYQKTEDGRAQIDPLRLHPVQTSWKGCETSTIKNRCGADSTQEPWRGATRG